MQIVQNARQGDRVVETGAKERAVCGCGCMRLSV